VYLPTTKPRPPPSALVLHLQHHVYPHQRPFCFLCFLLALHRPHYAVYQSGLVSGARSQLGLPTHQLYCALQKLLCFYCLRYFSPHPAGRDWASLLRDSHLSSGIRVGDTFDAWRFLVDPAHPLATEPLSGPPLRWSPIYPHHIVPPFNFNTAPLRGDSSSGESPNIFCIPYSRLPLTPNLAFTLNLYSEL
ncbi:hypothetical protein DFH09DRAFT_1363757, partial [Mycena vulgaris]